MEEEDKDEDNESRTSGPQDGEDVVPWESDQEKSGQRQRVTDVVEGRMESGEVRYCLTQPSF